MTQYENRVKKNLYQMFLLSFIPPPKVSTPHLHTLICHINKLWGLRSGFALCRQSTIACTEHLGITLLGFGPETGLLPPLQTM